jgi:hypothetical protein
VGGAKQQKEVELAGRTLVAQQSSWRPLVAQQVAWRRQRQAEALAWRRLVAQHATQAEP